MLKRILSLVMCVTLIITMGVCLCSCKDSAADEFPVTIGNITIEEEPQNIVVLSSGLADIISYIGYDTKMVGKSTDCTHKYFERIPSMGSKTSPDTKAIIKSEADLVITDTDLSKKAANALKDAEITVVKLQNVTDINKLQTLYVNIGMILGGKVTGKAEAQKAYKELFDHLSDFKDNVPNDIITTACYLYFDEAGNLCTFTKGTLEYNTFSYCGALNAFETQETPQISIEQLKFATPTFIFYDSPEVLTHLKNQESLSNLAALTNNNTMQIKKSAFTHLGITFYDTIYSMIDFMFIPDDVATPDEAPTVSTPDELTADTTQVSTQEPSQMPEDSYSIE